MDVEFVLNAHTCIMYVASYMMKSERAMDHLLKHISEEVRNDEFHLQLKKIGATYLTHREVSAQEAVYLILSLPMKQLSRIVVFIDTNCKENFYSRDRIHACINISMFLEPVIC